MKITATLLILLPALSSFVIAQESAPENQSASASDETPYEIVITGEVTRSRLRDMIIEVEEAFFARFNELNDDDDYDIQCYKYTPTMSHISERVCEPEFMIRARSSNASETTFLLGQGGRDTINASQNSAFAKNPTAMRREVEKYYKILQQKLEAMTVKDATFRNIGNDLATLKNQLENHGQDD